MLILMCRAGDDRYAIDSHLVTEVVPRVALQSVPRSPDWVAGLFVYRGQVTPVLDLSRLTADQACPDRLSNRILLVSVQVEGVTRPAGLLVEQTTTERLDAKEEEGATMSASNSQWGAMRSDARGFFQLLDMDRVLSDERIGVVFSNSAE